jgi:hypothetical protein
MINRTSGLSWSYPVRRRDRGQVASAVLMPIVTSAILLTGLAALIHAIPLDELLVV